MHSRPIQTPRTGTLPIAQVMISLQIPESVRGCPGPGEITIDLSCLALYISCKVQRGVNQYQLANSDHLDRAHSPRLQGS